MKIDRKTVNSKEEFIKLASSIAKESYNWNYDSPQEYIEAMANWLEDCDGFYNNMNIKMDPQKPSWQIFADALQAATVYS